MLFKWLIIFIVVYVLYRFFFGLVVPMYQTTRRMKDKVDELNRKMQESQQQYQQQQQKPVQQPKPADEDYIEFEEIKN